MRVLAVSVANGFIQDVIEAFGSPSKYRTATNGSVYFEYDEPIIGQFASEDELQIFQYKDELVNLCVKAKARLYSNTEAVMDEGEDTGVEVNATGMTVVMCLQGIKTKTGYSVMFGNCYNYSIDGLVHYMTEDIKEKDNWMLAGIKVSRATKVCDKYRKPDKKLMILLPYKLEHYDYDISWIEDHLRLRSISMADVYVKVAMEEFMKNHPEEANRIKAMDEWQSDRVVDI